MFREVAISLYNSKDKLYSTCVKERGGWLPHCVGFFDGSLIKMARLVCGKIVYSSGVTAGTNGCAA